jgi:hypothetical protein
VAPGVDPISACKALGADMTPQGTQPKPADKTPGEQTSEEPAP